MVIKSDNDIVRDIIGRIQKAQDAQQRRLDADMSVAIEAEIRSVWGGNKIHIARTPRIAQAERASRVMRAYLDGKRLTEIARQEGVSTRWVIKIVKR
jgi:Mor family transcriptional regulator